MFSVIRAHRESPNELQSLNIDCGGTMIDLFDRCKNNSKHKTKSSMDKKEPALFRVLETIGGDFL